MAEETVTVTEAVSAQLPEETITEYVVEEVGLTTIVAEVDPVVQEKLLPPEAVSVALFPPHTTVFPEMEAVMLDATVTVMLAVSAQDPEEAITEYVVVEVGETVMDEVLAPVVHEYVFPPVALSTVFPPVQIVVEPVMFAVIVLVMVTVMLVVSAQVPEEAMTE